MADKKTSHRKVTTFRKTAAAAARRSKRPAVGGGRRASATGALALKLADTPAVVRSVKEGLAYAAFVALRDKLGLPSENVGAYVQITARTLARRKNEGRLRSDESERVVRFSRIVESAIGLFENDASAARRWLSTPAKALGGETPLEYARTEIGAREVERLIERLEHGVYS